VQPFLVPLTLDVKLRRLFLEGRTGGTPGIDEAIDHRLHLRTRTVRIDRTVALPLLLQDAGPRQPFERGIDCLRGAIHPLGDAVRTVEGVRVLMEKDEEFHPFRTPHHPV
jgi:hypothetical protein